MKPIDKMNNVEKAHLLHQLFPEEIPAFVDYMKRVCETIKEHEAEEQAKGKYSVSTFEFWHDLVKDAERRIDRYGEQLHKRARLFADQLFDGQNALFARYCLELYVGTRKHENQTFTGLVRVLFRTDAIQ